MRRADAKRLRARDDGLTMNGRFMDWHHRAISKGRLPRRFAIAAMVALLAFLVSNPQGMRSVAAGEPALTVAIPGFFGSSPDELAKGRDLVQVIGSDLRDSGKFTPLDPGKYNAMVISADAVPEFGKWRALNTEALVTGLLSLQPDGRFKVEFRLWDVASGQHLSGAQYFVAPDRLHQVAHLVAESIYQQLTGQAARFGDKN